MSQRAMLKARDLDIRVPAEKLTLMCLADRAHDDGSGAYPSLKRLAYETGAGVETVRGYLNKYEELGWITCTAPARRGRGKTYAFDWEQCSFLPPWEALDAGERDVALGQRKRKRPYQTSRKKSASPVAEPSERPPESGGQQDERTPPGSGGQIEEWGPDPGGQLSERPPDPGTMTPRSWDRTSLEQSKNSSSSSGSGRLESEPAPKNEPSNPDLAAARRDDDDDGKIDLSWLPQHLRHHGSQLREEITTLGRSVLVPDLAARVVTLWGAGERTAKSVKGWVVSKRKDYPTASVLLAAIVTAAEADQPNARYANKVLRQLPPLGTVRRIQSSAARQADETFARMESRNGYARRYGELTAGWSDEDFDRLREDATAELRATPSGSFLCREEEDGTLAKMPGFDSALRQMMHTLVVETGWRPTAPASGEAGEVPA
ncbi:MAG: helix-turn-helix domain-containing protein [Bacteroidota bacterium]